MGKRFFLAAVVHQDVTLFVGRNIGQSDAYLTHTVVFDVDRERLLQKRADGHQRERRVQGVPKPDNRRQPADDTVGVRFYVEVSRMRGSRGYVGNVRLGIYRLIKRYIARFRGRIAFQAVLGVMNVLLVLLQLRCIQLRRAGRVHLEKVTQHNGGI